ncbi:MAG: hypothetical protein KJ626_00415 [Verrucomicrobia bacterium]|nr:hypothetical protein [Verrucomicrobiota bacterium]
MKRIVWALILITGWAMQWAPAASSADRERYVEVEAEDVLRSPQSFWLIGIVFSDTLLSPPSDRLTKINDSRYAEFSTKIIGKCYASTELLPDLKDAEPGQEFIFTGTVISTPGSFFGGKAGYEVVVSKAVPSIAASDEKAADIFAGLTDDTVVPEGQPLEEMLSILTRTKANLVGYVLENDLDLTEVFESESKHSTEIRDIIRQIVRSEENERKTTSSEILTRFIYALIKQDALGSESEESEMGEPAVEATEEPDAKPLSKRELKRLAKERKKAEEEADKARIVAEKKLAAKRAEAEKQREKDEAMRQKKEERASDAKVGQSGKRRFFGLLGPKKTAEQIAEEQRLEQEKRADEAAEREAAEAQKLREKEETRRAKEDAKRKKQQEKSRKKAATEQEEPADNGDIYAPIGR